MNRTPSQTIALVARKNSNFAQSLVSQYQSKGRLSEAQWNWANKLANEVVESDASNAADLTATYAAIERAEIRLARFHIGDVEVKLRPNRNRTSYYALVGDAHLGSILSNGQFRRGAGMGAGGLTQKQVLEGLHAFGEDPVAVMAKYGLATGTCGVCGRRLEDPESVARGIGPVCFEKLAG